jgi:hypothetical protein
LVPILLFDHPGLTDHSNALARLHILTSPPDSAVRAVYEPAWGVIPNLAIDAFGVPLVLFNLAVSMGYFNYLAGVAIALVGLLLWIRLAEGEIFSLYRIHQARMAGRAPHARSSYRSDPDRRSKPSRFAGHRNRPIRQSSSWRVQEMRDERDAQATGRPRQVA